MKKIISFILVVGMLFTLAVPAWARIKEEGEGLLIEGKESISDGNYPSGILLLQNSELTIQGNVDFSYKIVFYDAASSIVIKSGATLTGSNLMAIINYGGQAPFIIEDGGKLNLSFNDTSTEDADKFEKFLSDNQIGYKRVGNQIVVGCDHETIATTTQVTTTVERRCGDCGIFFDTQTTTETSETKGAAPTASAFSEGNSTIVFCAVCLAVGLAGGYLLGRKKKPALADGASGEDSE